MKTQFLLLVIFITSVTASTVFDLSGSLRCCNSDGKRKQELNQLDQQQKGSFEGDDFDPNNVDDDCAKGNCGQSKNPGNNGDDDECNVTPKSVVIKLYDSWFGKWKEYLTSYSFVNTNKYELHYTGHRLLRFSPLLIATANCGDEMYEIERKIDNAHDVSELSLVFTANDII